MALAKSEETEVAKTDLARLTFEEKKAIIDKKVEQILSLNRVIENQVDHTTSTLPRIWKISSLTENCNFIVQGFEKFCTKLTINTSSGKNKHRLNDNTIIDLKDQLISNLSHLLDNPKLSDMIIKVSDDEIIYSHSFIWKLNNFTSIDSTQNPIIIECQDVSKSLMLKFLSFYYSGIIEIPNEIKTDILKLANRFNCRSLVTRLATQV